VDKQAKRLIPKCAAFHMQLIKIGSATIATVNSVPKRIAFSSSTLAATRLLVNVWKSQLQRRAVAKKLRIAVCAKPSRGGSEITEMLEATQSIFRFNYAAISTTFPGSQ
jgi:hypothetical protein